MTDLNRDCTAPLHPQAAEGLRLFNAGKYFEAHEALEIAWLEERGTIRNLYRGILQVGVAYLHITRGNYNGAVKVYGRSLKWLKGWADICRGIHVEQLRRDAEAAINEIKRLGREKIGEFDFGLLKPVRWEQVSGTRKHVHICDRCGTEMHENNCKVTCPNCGNRFDCSDLNINFD
jgi:predicted metal-dependent hydrolase